MSSRRTNKLIALVCLVLAIYNVTHVINHAVLKESGLKAS